LSVSTGISLSKLNEEVSGPKIVDSDFHTEASEFVRTRIVFDTSSMMALSVISSVRRLASRPEVASALRTVSMRSGSQSWRVERLTLRPRFYLSHSSRQVLELMAGVTEYPCTDRDDHSEDSATPMNSPGMTSRAVDDSIDQRLHANNGSQREGDDGLVVSWNSPGRGHVVDRPPFAWPFEIVECMSVEKIS